MHVLFEGLPRAVDAQLARALVAARRREPWEELRALQARRCPAASRWDGAATRAARRVPGPRVAYVDARRASRALRARSPSASLEAMCSPS